MTEKTYTDDEVREIFGLAASGHDLSNRLPTPKKGFTLAEIQGIGREVGLDPAHVANAAATLESRAVALPRTKLLGMPVAVGRIIPLQRAPTDSEWEQIVTELRTTFGAKGKFTGQGGLREWTNGNLHAYVEPADGGYRLRLRTVKGNAAMVNGIGAVLFVGGWVGIASAALGGLHLPDLITPVGASVLGLGAIVSNMIRLPIWAKQREAQMDYVAEKTAGIISDRS